MHHFDYYKRLAHKLLSEESVENSSKSLVDQVAWALHREADEAAMKVVAHERLRRKKALKHLETAMGEWNLGDDKAVREHLEIARRVIKGSKYGP